MLASLALWPSALAGVDDGHRRVSDHAATPRLFCSIQRRVGSRQQRPDRPRRIAPRFLGHRRDTDRHIAEYRTATFTDERLNKPVSKGRAFGFVRIRRNDRELIAADSSGYIGPSQRTADRVGDAHQCSISSGVTPLIVDALQVIDIDEQQRYGYAVPVALFQPIREMFMKRSSISETGERIVLRQRR